MLTKLQVDPNALPNFTLQQGIIRFNGKVWVGNQGELRGKLIHSMHDTSWGGHSGIYATQQRLRALFHWPSLAKDVKSYVQTCEVCQRNKGEQVAYPGLLQPLPLPEKAWEHLAMDFIEGLPKSQGKEMILVVIDRYTKYSHFFALTHPYSASQIAQVFVDNICKLHGVPCSIVSDRDPLFTSFFWKELFSQLQVKLRFSSAYHPQSDGQSERLNRCLETYLRCMTGHKPTDWSKWLPLAEFWYNTNFHSTIGMTPFKALYGYDPPLPTFELICQSKVESVDQMLKNRQLMVKALRENLLKAQSRMKQQADSKRSERSFEVGDMVYLKLQPYRQISVVVRKSLKLAAKFYGPYKVIRKIGAVAYELELPPGSRIHPVFHVSQLKKKVGDRIVPSIDPPYCSDNGQIRVEPVAILEHRMVKKGNRAAAKVLVQWANLSPEEATWEDYNFLKSQFPEFKP